jgi:hypothetical protein
MAKTAKMLVAHRSADRAFGSRIDQGIVLSNKTLETWHRQRDRQFGVEREWKLLRNASWKLRRLQRGGKFTSDNPVQTRRSLPEQLIMQLCG